MTNPSKATEPNKATELNKQQNAAKGQNTTLKIVERQIPTKRVDFNKITKSSNILAKFQ